MVIGIVDITLGTSPASLHSLTFQHTNTSILYPIHNDDPPRPYRKPRCITAGEATGILEDPDAVMGHQHPQP